MNKDRCQVEIAERASRCMQPVVLLGSDAGGEVQGQFFAVYESW